MLLPMVLPRRALAVRNVAVVLILDLLVLLLVSFAGSMGPELYFSILPCMLGYRFFLPVGLQVCGEDIGKGSGPISLAGTTASTTSSSEASSAPPAIAAAAAAIARVLSTT